MSMDIYAGTGTKVVYENPNSGYKGDQEQAAEHLQLGGIYTVSRTEIHSWHTNVFLEEAPNIPFNSVLFNDVKESTQIV